MFITVLKESEWKELPTGQEPGAPTWLKMPNGNIVLAVYLEREGASGWWECTFKDGQFYASTSKGYMAKGAKWQAALSDD